MGMQAPIPQANPNTPVSPEQVQQPMQNQPVQQPQVTPESGASLMGVAPQTQPAQQQPQQQNLLGTPYQTPEQLAEGYRNIQSQYTQVNQRYNELQQNYNTVMQLLNQQATAQPQQQTQQQTASSILGLDGEAFAQALEQNPKASLMQLAEEVALKKLQPTINQLQQQVQASQTILNQQAVDRTLQAMEATYGNTDPNYKQNLNAAVDMVLGPLKSAAESDPAGTLNMAYEMILGRQLKDPNFVNQLQQSAAQRVQQQQQMKQMGAVTTSQTQAMQPTYQPYNPQPNTQNGMAPQDLARQIASYSDPSVMSGLQNLRVQQNPF